MRKSGLQPTLIITNIDKTIILIFIVWRINNYDEFFAIWWEEILDNNSWVILIEWPDLIEKYYSPDLEIILKKTDNPKQREIEIKKKS